VKVAYYSPLPPSRSGVADYSTLLLPALREHVEVVTAKPGRFRREPTADVALYHVGNDAEAHGWIVEALRRRPGVVVLHEFVLHHLVVGLTFARGDAAGYRAAMEREAGLVGYLLAHAVLDNKIPPLWETRPEDFPLAGEILDRATGLIVHSRFVEEQARNAGYDGPVWRIPHPAWPVPSLEPVRIDGDPLFGCFGHLNESKRIPQLLRAFARFRESRPEARLLLVGGASTRLEGRLDAEGVVREGYVDETRLWHLMATCDACISLRSPTMGETSGSVIRALSLGRPLVVSDVGWFSELPDDVALKVAVDEREVDALAAALELLAADGRVREEAAGRKTVHAAALGDVATAAAEVGLTETGELAERLREVGLGG
jgi:glycosyltransferase involved in cell wall biosynthesis